MNILITGHEGFIGQNLGAYLQSKGHNVEGFEWNFPRLTPNGIIQFTSNLDSK